MAELLEPSVARTRQLLGFPLVDADIAAGANINATKIGTGVVDNTEFNRLNGITSALEEQGNKGAVSGYAGLNASQELTNDLALISQLPSLTINRALISDASGVIIVSAVTNTELALLDGATTLELQANKGAVSGYAGLDASQELLLTNFPTGTGLQHLRRNAGNTALEFGDPPVVSLTPWTEDIVAAGFDLRDLSNIEFRNTTGAPAGTVPNIHVAGDDMFLNVGLNDAIIFQFNNITAMTLLTDRVIFPAGRDIHVAEGANIIWAGNTSREINNNAGGFAFKVESNDTYVFAINFIPKLTITETEIDIEGNNLVGVGILSFDDVNTSIQQASADLQLDVASGGAVVLRVNNVAEYDFDATQADWNGNNLINVGLLNLKIDNATAVMEMEANHTTPANAQIVGQIDFIDDSSTGVRRTYGEIRVLIEDPTNTTEDGEMFIRVMRGGSVVDYIALNEANDDNITFKKALQIDTQDIITDTTTGTKIGTGTTQKIGFWNATPVIQPTGAGADLTNSVTVGGTNNTIADFTDLSTYATDAAAIRNDIFQLARSVKFLQDSMRLVGLNST